MITITEEVAKGAGVMQLPNICGVSKLSAARHTFSKWCKIHLEELKNERFYKVQKHQK